MSTENDQVTLSYLHRCLLVTHVIVIVSMYA